MKTRPEKDPRYKFRVKCLPNLFNQFNNVHKSLPRMWVQIQIDYKFSQYIYNEI